MTRIPQQPPSAAARDHLDVIVIGAGQAGLAMGWYLRHSGIRFLILDGSPQVGHSWRTRWDSLRLFTPAQYDTLPGMPFPAAADTYPSKDDVADYLESYARQFELPVLLNCSVQRIDRDENSFVVHTTQGTLRTRQVVVATGPFQRPTTPALAASVPARVVQLHSAEYRNPDQLPHGPVLVVGGGNSGLQIAAELADKRQVTLSVGSTPPKLPQRVLGRDIFWWLTRFGVMSKTAQTPLARRMQARGDVIIGSSPHKLRRAGVRLGGRLVSVTDDEVRLSDGTLPTPASIIWATGFTSDYSWINIPEAFSHGAIRHDRGVSNVDGLYFVGLPWQHTRGSALLGFVRKDAAWLAYRMSVHHADMKRRAAGNAPSAGVASTGGNPPAS